ncbi:MAG: hypothetical protein GWN47_04225 [Woeseiaceae bacterium]|nr:hypothetical protein [Woeseiaceae bacterium]
MDFHPPAAEDLANVRSLNSAFLRIVRDSISGKKLQQSLPEDLRGIVASLNDVQLERLSESPFLLLSFREHDSTFWNVLDEDNLMRDLFVIERAADEKERLIMAGLGFLWQLAKRNAYAARLVTGAPLAWCERIADTTLIRLLQAVANRDEMPGLRFAGQRKYWEKLLGAGLDSAPAVRAAAQMTVLQTMLTAETGLAYRSHRAAACPRPVSVRRRHGLPGSG